MERWFEWQNIPWYDEKENVIGVILQTEDVTDKVSLELKAEKLAIILELRRFLFTPRWARPIGRKGSRLRGSESIFRTRWGARKGEQGNSLS